MCSEFKEAQIRLLERPIRPFPSTRGPSDGLQNARFHGAIGKGANIQVNLNSSSRATAADARGAQFGVAPVRRALTAAQKLRAADQVVALAGLRGPANDNTAPNAPASGGSGGGLN